MSAALAVPLFLVSLAVTLAAARLFARRLDRLGVRFGFPEALIGLLTAVAADGPEISSALFALAKGAHDVGVGVLVGSNGFNLAAMIGVSALVTGRVRLARETLLFEGTVGLIITLLASALLLRWLSPGGTTIASAVVAVPYLTVVIAGPRFRGHYLSRLSRALHEHAATDRPPDTSSDPTHHLLALIVVDLILIVAGSAGMVQSALSLAGDWHISNAVLGFLILGPLTSIPNALTAVRLGLAGRGAALVGETFNSNTINLGFGVIVPSLFVTFAAVSTLGKLQLAWLIGATLVTMAALARPGGMNRAGGAVLVGPVFRLRGGYARGLMNEQQIRGPAARQGARAAGQGSAAPPDRGRGCSWSSWSPWSWSASVATGGGATLEPDGHERLARPSTTTARGGSTHAAHAKTFSASRLPKSTVTGVGTGKPGTATVPVLMYHVINPPPAGAPFPGLYVPSDEFAAQMQALKARRLARRDDGPAQGVLDARRTARAR